MKKKCIVQTKNIDDRGRIQRVVFAFILFACSSMPISSAKKVIVDEWRFSLDMKHAAMIKVFDEIEKKSDFVFAWSCDVDAEIHRDISIHVSGAPISSIMEILLEDTDLTYRRLEKQIVIYRYKVFIEGRSEESKDSVRTVKGMSDK